MLHPKLLHYISSIILDHPQGLSEYQLINQLCVKPYLVFNKAQMKTPIGLFKLHFILFHSLYLLRQQGLENKEYQLEISSLNIKKTAYVSPKANLSTYDALADYYLDLSQLEKTNEDDIDKMLQYFWNNYLASDQKKEALLTLEINGTCDSKIIKQQYRKLANLHHPDKGGDKESFIKIQHAKETLMLHY